MINIKGKLKTVNLLKRPKNIFVLSFNGGGLRGISSMVVLEYITNLLGIDQIPNLFDVQVPVSTGAIILSGLNTINRKTNRFMTPSEGIEGYKILAPKSLSKKDFGKAINGSIQKLLNRLYLNGPQHCSKKKHAYIIKFLHQSKIKDLSSDTKIFSPLLDLKSSDIDIYSNYFKDDGDLPLSDIVNFSSTAIPYFSPLCKIQNKINKNAIYCDFCYASPSPSVLAYTIARKLYPKSNIHHTMFI